MCFGMDKTRHPAQPIAKQNVPDARRVHPKDGAVALTCGSSFYISNTKRRASKSPAFVV